MESIDSVCVGVGTNSSLNDRPSAVCILFLHVSRMLCYLSCLARKSSSQIWKYCAALCVVPTMTWCFRFMRYRLTMHIHCSLMVNIFSTHHMIPCVDTANWYPWQHNTWRKNSSSCRIFRRCTNSWNGTLVSVYSTYAGTYLALQTVSVFSFPRPRPYNPSSPSPASLTHTHTHHLTVLLRLPALSSTYTQFRKYLAKIGLHLAVSACTSAMPSPTAR